MKNVPQIVAVCVLALCLAGCPQASRVGLVVSETAATTAESLEHTNPDRAARIAKAVIKVNQAQIIYNVAFAQSLCAGDAALAGCDQVPTLGLGVDASENQQRALIALGVAKSALAVAAGGTR